MNRWNDFYKEDSRILSAPISATSVFAKNIFDSKKCSNILDLGCGIGRDTLALSNDNRKIVGVDLSFYGLSLACKNSKMQNCNFVQNDARFLSFKDNSFDGIYCFGLLHELTSNTWHKELEQIMNEIYRTLNKNGVLVLAVLFGHPKNGLPHVRLFSNEMFDNATHDLICENKCILYDIGCTGSTDYKIIQGTFLKP